ncbi:MAG: hypothetical protein HYX89_05525 [Chloroflexi bacterium]|nr:hypothetical protein [Chloroflexota bacterium]
MASGKNKRFGIVRGVLLFLFFLGSYSYVIQGPGWNEHSRYDLILAMAEEGRVQIDSYHENTGDKSFYNGHYYSDKAIGTSLLGLPVYKMVKIVEGLAKYQERYPIHIVTAFVSALPGALLALLVYGFLGYLGIIEGFRVLLTLVFGFGTLAFPFSSEFFGHQTSSFFAFGAFLLTFLVTRRGWSQAWLLVAGLSAGAAVLTEYPAVIIAFLLFGYLLLLTRRPAALILFVVGALPVAAIQIAYNVLAFDSPFRLSYAYVDVVSQPMFAGAREGLFGVTAPSLSTLREILFSPRGLLVLSPLSLLTPLGLWLMVLRKQLWPEAALFSAIIVAFLIYNSGYYDPFGGVSPGPRFLIPMLPYAVIPLAFLPRGGRWLLLPLALVSVLAMTLLTVGGPKLQPYYDRPWYDLAFWLPFISKGEKLTTLGSYHLGLTGSAQLLSLGLFVAAAILALTWSYRPSVWAPLLRGTTVLVAAFYIAVAFPLDLRRAGDVPAILAALEAPTVEIVQATVEPPKVSQDQTVSVAAKVRTVDRRGVNVLVDLEIYDPKGAKVYQTWYDSVNLWPEQDETRVFQWQVPPDATPGSYRILVEVKSYDWRETYIIREAGPLEIGVDRALGG